MIDIAKSTHLIHPVQDFLAAYLAVELEEKLAELEGLQGKWPFNTKAASGTEHVENRRVDQKITRRLYNIWFY